MATEVPATGSHPSRMRPWSTAASGAFLIACCAAGYWITQRPLPDNDGALVVPESDLNFGEQWEDRRFQWKVRLKNPHSTPISIVSWSASCDCVRDMKLEATTIAPNAESAINLVLDLSAAFVKSPPDTLSQKFAASVNLHLQNQLAIPRVITISGNVKRALILSSRSIDFGDIIYGEPRPCRQIKASAQLALQTIFPRYKERFVQVDVARTHPSTDIFELSVQPRPDLSVGRFQCELELQPDQQRLDPCSTGASVNCGEYHRTGASNARRTPVGWLQGW